MTQAKHDDEEASALTLKADWSGSLQVPVLPANVFLAQVGVSGKSGRPDGIYLVAGHLMLPLLLGTPQEVTEQVRKDLGGRIPVTVHTKLFLTRDRAEELVTLLVDTIAKIDSESEAR